ncbi:MAG: serine/threonine protein kinase [Synergistaceae bacterium]|jgi:serine/threonine protein kinase|nr:serine/threonine protein kinase [Synergistaceae bacterium]
MTDIKQYEPLWGSWLVESLLGEGSFGKVYKVKKEEFGKSYYSAVKILSIPQNEGDLRRAQSEGLDKASARSYFHAFVMDIIQEVDLMSAFRGNSNIVSLEDHKVIEKENEIGWDILIRMELLTSLSEYVTQYPLPPEEVVKLGIHICRGLEFCALRKTIHRDIKPDNIFVSQYGDYKLGDFGIARQIERTLSGLSKKGTETYMAPEVFRGEEYGASVDLYSLGIVMYRYLNQNRPPFWPAFPSPVTPHDREEALQRRMKGVPLPSIEGIDSALNDIVLRACAFDRRERFENATEMKEALESLAGGGNYAPLTPESFVAEPPKGKSSSIPRDPSAHESWKREFTADVLESPWPDRKDGTEIVLPSCEEVKNVDDVGEEELNVGVSPKIVKRLAILSGIFFGVLGFSCWLNGFDYVWVFFSLYALCVVECILQLRNKYMNAFFLLTLALYLSYSFFFAFEIFDYHLFIMTCSLFALETARAERRNYGSLLCGALIVCAFVSGVLVVRSLYGIQRDVYHAYVAGAVAIPFLMLSIALAGLFLIKKNTSAASYAVSFLIASQFFPVMAFIAHSMESMRGIYSRSGIDVLFYVANATFLKISPNHFLWRANAYYMGMIVQCFAFIPFFLLAFMQITSEACVLNKKNSMKLLFAVAGFIVAIAVLTDGMPVIFGFLP